MDDLKSEALKLVGWYSPPNLRGTLDIVWGCAITVFICTWTANHVNVPPHGSKSGWRFLYKLKITMFSLLTPEYAAAVAAVDLRTAVILTHRMRKLGLKKWTLKHSFFVGMGGYMIGCGNVWKALDVDTFVECYESGHIQIDGSNTADKATAHGSPKVMVERRDTWPLERKASITQTSTTSTNDMIILPSISEMEIDDRAKADWLLKLIACGQLTWLIIQLIGRAVQHLSLSTLEATTVSYVSCALFAYASWWNKPYDLQSPIAVSVPADSPLWRRLKDGPSYIRFDYEPKLDVDRRTQVLYCIGSLVLAETYCGLHLLAWNVHFGSEIEQQLWRWLNMYFIVLHVFVFFASLISHSRASVIKMRENCIASWQWLAECVLKPIMPKATQPFFRLLHILDSMDEEALPPWPARWTLLVMTFLYVWTSLYLLAESFVGLRRMPMLLYITVNRVQLLPHIH